MTKPEITIILPSLNVAEYIEECINSVIGQSIDNIEILCIDAGSNDGTLEIIHKYMEHDSRIRLINSNIKSYGYQVNRGIDEAKGRYIGIVETDDYVENNMYEKLYRYANENNAQVVKSNYYKYYGKSENKNKFIDSYKNIPEGLSVNPKDYPEIILAAPSIWSGIYERKFLKDNNIRFLETPGAAYQDTSFILKVFFAADNIVIDKNAYVHYRLDNANQSVQNQSNIFSVCEELREAEAYLEQSGKKNIFEKYMAARTCITYLWNYDRISEKKKSVFLEEMKNKITEMEEKKLLDKQMFTDKTWTRISNEVIGKRRKKDSMNNIKILVCYHKKAPLFKDNILTPIHVGRANAIKNMDHESDNYKWLMDNLIGDNDGENISDKNGSYNEMTALYWAWKNYDKLGNPDYIGLMHYRRHFVLREGEIKCYNIQKYNPEHYYDQINYSEKKMQKMVDGCDFVTHIGKVNNVYNHFIENQRKTDIDLANEIVLEMYPEYEDIMKEYYEGDLSNFCNMTIFSKKLFFEYCEWIFSIMEEFEKRVNIDEKRFFISERLSGIFIAKLMKNKKLKHKIVPISFIDEPVEVAVGLYAGKNNKTDNAITMKSIIEKSKGYNSYHFYLFGNKDVSDEEIKQYKYFEKYEKCYVDFVRTDVDEDYIPLVLSDLLPKVNKCIYINGRVIAQLEIAEFYHICSVDDYYLIGTPEGIYDRNEVNKRLNGDFLLINCARMRKHNVAGKISEYINNEVSGTDALNEICKNQIGYIAWYYYTSERLSEHNLSELFDTSIGRGQLQSESFWRPFLIFDGFNPYENAQGTYSLFWWEKLNSLPYYFQSIIYNEKALENIFKIQMQEIKAKEK